jgi:UDP-galactopyranose mutase
VRFTARWRKKFIDIKKGKVQGEHKMITDPTVQRPEDLVCFSHLRWGFVFQRPQHLMSRFAAQRRVFFVEEAVREDGVEPGLRFRVCDKTKVNVVTPVIPTSAGPQEAAKTMGRLVRELFRRKKIVDYFAWFYTPMALDYCGKLKAKAAVYDCMDELSLFRHAPPQLAENEKRLFGLCDLVFTGGIGLYEAKRNQHDRVYPFPSSVDCAHFAQARKLADTAGDQRDLPKPRLGYAGVIDERIDLGLIREVAERRPDWQIVMIGPVVKIDPATLPRLSNIHWLGMKDYSELPRYFAGWDVATMPFAMNDSTRFISPTKTPEYLAAGLPVVSTPIRDVVRQYGDIGLVRIAMGTSEFLAQTEQAMTFGMTMKWRQRADAFLGTLSWDSTWEAMNLLIDEVATAKNGDARVPALRASESGAVSF